MKKLFISAGLLLALSALVGSTSKSAVREQHVTGRSMPIQTALAVPSHVRKLMDKSCNNCHSYETNWPWYAHMAPVNWLIDSDVSRARAAANFSEWSTGPGRTMGSAIGTLMAACEGAKSGRMPPVQYRLMHPEAALSTAEIDSFCSWTRSAVREMAGRRRQSGLQHVSN